MSSTALKPQARAARVQDVSYELQLELVEGRETYTGRAVITFALHPNDGPLFLDFSGAPRSACGLNGEDIEPDHRDHRLWLTREQLRTHNRLVIDYENTYDATGDGLHRFVDPEDGATYIYSNLEPFSAHRIFPCFDQPDIKATYHLAVTAPASMDRRDCRRAGRGQPRGRRPQGPRVPAIACASRRTCSLSSPDPTCASSRATTVCPSASTGGPRCGLSWSAARTRSSKSPARAWTTTPTCSAGPIPSPSTTSSSCPSSTPGPWRTSVP